MQGHFYTNTTSPFADITAHVRERSRVVRHLHLRLTSTFACIMFSGNSFTFELTHWNVCSLCGRWNTCLGTIKRIFQRFRQQSESLPPPARRGDVKHMTESNIQSTDHWALQPIPSISAEPIQALNRPVRCFTLAARPLFSSSVSRILTITTTTFARKLKYTSVCWKNNNSVMIIIITRRLIDPRRRIVSFFILTPRGQRSEVGGRGAVPRCRILQ